MTYQWTVTFTADHDPILDGYECVSHADSMIAAIIMRTKQSDFGLILGPIQEC